MLELCEDGSISQNGAGLRGNFFWKSTHEAPINQILHNIPQTDHLDDSDDDHCFTLNSTASQQQENKIFTGTTRLKVKLILTAHPWCNSHS